MSLQGTLDTFALPDVLRLLAATSKTGHLSIDGSRGSGNLWLDAGSVVAAEATTARPSADPAAVLFELLRFPDGGFSFDNDQTTSDAGAPLEVEPLLTEAEGLLDEWRSIEAVVPSLRAWVALVPELPRPTVAVTAEQWRVLVAVGGGTTVGALGDAFDLGELEVSRSVKALVEAGLVAVGAVHIDAAPPAPAVVPDPRRAASLAAAVAPAADLGELAALADSRHPDTRHADAGELSRQLAQLGPDAAQAVMVAASAETVEEREAALATIEGEVDGEPINRGLLLKFLSSVRS